MQYSYEITPRPAELGGGWRLRLLEDGEEVGGGAFPVAPADPQQGMAWWNAMAETERGHWLSVAGSARPADAYDAFMLAEAHIDAEDEAYAWLDSRDA
jgi:hypothetical protein